MSVDSTARDGLIQLFAEVFMQPFDPSVADIRREEVAAWDSISHLRLVMDIEAVYGIALSDEEIMGIGSLGDVGRLLAARGVEGFTED
jgi:acyl carrier protein